MAFRPPQGSTFRHPAVQRAMQELAKAVEAQRAAGVGVTPYRHPDGSAFQSAKVQQGLRALGEAAGQAGQAPQPEYRRPSGSSLDSPAVRRAMQGLGDVQADVQFKRPTGSSLDSPAVQRASQGLAETQADVTFARPSGSSLDSPAVRRAMQGLGDVQADVQFKRPTGSSLDSPAVQRASQGLAETQADVSFARPTGSSLDSPAVRRAMQGIGEAGGVDVDFKRPSGSSLDSPAVVQGLRALGEAAGQAAGVSFRRPSPATLANSEVRQGVQALSKLQEQMERQGANPGVTGVMHPARPDGLAERKAEAVAKVQMPNSSLYFAHNALNGGEISPEMLARFDQPRYQTGCEYLLNMVPMPQGGITKRPGIVSVGAGGTGVAKLFPFVFSAGESRMLELVSSGEGSTLTVWFPDGSSYASGLELPYGASEIRGVQMAQSSDVLYVVHTNHAPAKIMRYGDQDWRYTVVDWMPSISAPNISGIWMSGDSSGSRTTYRYVATAISGETGEESLPSPPQSVSGYALSQTYYTSVQVGAVAQAIEYRIYKYRGGVYGYVGSIYPETSGVLGGVAIGFLQAQVGEHWIGVQTRTVVRYVNPRQYGFNPPGSDSDVTSDIAVSAHASQNAFLFPSIGKALVRVVKTTTTTEYKEEYVPSGDPDYNFEYRWVQQEPVTSTSYEWVMLSYSGDVAGIYASWSTGSLGSNEAYPSGTVNEYSVAPYFTGGISSGGSLMFEDRNIEPDTADTPPRVKNPFDGAGNYPGVVFFHQQRLGFASSDNQPLTVWLSQAGNFESMAASLPPSDDDAIEATLAATQANRILWCQSDRTSLAVGTEGGEWILAGTEEGGAVTPSNLSFQPQTSNGSEPGLPVLRAGAGLVYMQRGGRVAREFGYAFASDRYESGDLSLLARHILKESPVVSWAWQGEPYGIVWCVLGNGRLAGLTYMKEHDVVAWHRHETAGTVEDVAAMPGADGNTQIWFHVVRGGVRYVERLDPFFEGGGAAAYRGGDGDPLNLSPFQARCVPCLPETSMQSGTTFLRVRKLNAVKARVVRSSPFQARVGSDAPQSVPARGSAYVEGHADWALPLASGWRENDRLELVFDGSAPATVLGIVTTVEVAEEGGGQK